MNIVNHQFRLATRPVGLPKRSDWALTEEPVAEPAEGDLLVKVLYISLDPAMRGWMNEGRSYIPPVELGAVMRALAVGRVIASKNPKYAVGDHVSGSLRCTGICAVQWRRAHQGRHRRRPVDRVAECLRCDRDDGVFRPPRNWFAQGR